MFLSIIIPTYCRPLALKRVLKSFRTMDAAKLEPCELIIVNNYPQQQITSLLDFKKSGITIRNIEARQTGLSHARNCGIEYSRGEWLAFIDDDVIISSQWLQAIAKGIKDYPEASFFGGRIIGVFQGTAPSWYHYEQIPAWLNGVLGNYDLGEDDYRYDPESMEEFFGANLIFKKSLIQECGGFDIELGIAAHREKRTGEDTEIIRRMCAKHAIGYYLGQASVRHLPPSICLQSDYIYSYFQTCGKSAAHIDAEKMSAQSCNQEFLDLIDSNVGYLQTLFFELTALQDYSDEEAIIKTNSGILKTKSYLIERLKIRLDNNQTYVPLFYHRVLHILSNDRLTVEQCIKLKGMVQARCEQEIDYKESDSQFIKNRVAGPFSYLGNLLVELQQAFSLTKEREIFRLQGYFAELLRIRLESDSTLQRRFYQTLLKSINSSGIEPHQCFIAQGRANARQRQDKITPLSNIGFMKLVLSHAEQIKKHRKKLKECNGLGIDESVQYTQKILNSRGFLQEVLIIRREAEGLSINLFHCYLIGIINPTLFSINLKRS